MSFADRCEKNVCHLDRNDYELMIWPYKILGLEEISFWMIFCAFHSKEKSCSFLLAPLYVTLHSYEIPVAKNENTTLGALCLRITMSRLLHQILGCSNSLLYSRTFLNLLHGKRRGVTELGLQSNQISDGFLACSFFLHRGVIIKLECKEQLLGPNLVHKHEQRIFRPEAILFLV